MAFKDKKGRKIKEQLDVEKIIMDVKNKDLKINFLKSYIWIIPLIPILAIVLNIGMINMFLEDSEKNIVFIIFGVSLLSTIILYCSQLCKIYFENDNLILENKLKMKKYFDIKKCPRIYVRQHIYYRYHQWKDSSSEEERYNLYIEQNNNLLNLSIRSCGYSNIQKLIDNLEMKSYQECSEEEWNLSVNNREQKMCEYARFLETHGKIVGVKDKNKNTIIGKNENLTLYILMIVLVFLIVFGLFLLKEEANVAALFILIGIIINIGGLINKINSNKMKISYENDIIKIDKYRLKYKENNIRLSIGIIQTPYTEEKYKYTLKIIGERNNYAIPLGKAKENEIRKFIDNLNFEEIKGY